MLQFFHYCSTAACLLVQDERGNPQLLQKACDRFTSTFIMTVNNKGTVSQRVRRFRPGAARDNRGERNKFKAILNRIKVMNSVANILSQVLYLVRQIFSNGCAVEQIVFASQAFVCE